jgi:hypothetical protein
MELPKATTPTRDCPRIARRGIESSQLLGRAGGGSASTGSWPALRCIAGSTVPRMVKTADYRPRWRAEALC